MRTLVCLLVCLCPVMLATWAVAQAPSLVVNGGFEEWEAVSPDAAGLVDGWKFGDPTVAASG